MGGSHCPRRKRCRNALITTQEQGREDDRGYVKEILKDFDQIIDSDLNRDREIYLTNDNPVIS